MMPTLTSNEVTKLADYARSISGALQNFCFRKCQSLSVQQLNAIELIRVRLLNDAEVLDARATNVIIESSGEPIKRLEDITNRLESTIRELENIETLITASASFVNIISVILTTIASGVPSRIDEVVKKTEESL